MSTVSFEFQTPLNIQNLDYLTLADMFADIVTGPDNQYVSMLLVAPQGYGKSTSALEIAHSTAEAIARYRGGTWQDYFPLNPDAKKVEDILPNVACIDQRDIIELLGRTEKNNVYLLDDVGVGMNSRKFYTQENILVNDIFELMRIDNTVIIMTMIDQSHIDKVPRELVPFYGEVVEKHHDKGYNLLKVFFNKKMYRKGKSYQAYPTQGKYKYTRFMCFKPPQEILSAYDRLREAKTREDKKAKVAKYLETCDNGGQKLTKREQKWQETLEQYGQKVVDLYQEGLTSPYKIAKKVPLHPHMITKVLVHNGIAME